MPQKKKLVELPKISRSLERQLSTLGKVTDIIGAEPIELLAQYVADPQTKPQVRIAVLRELLPYCYPRLISKTIQGSMQHDHRAVSVSLARALTLPELEALRNRLLMHADAERAAGAAPIGADVVG